MNARSSHQRLSLLSPPPSLSLSLSLWETRGIDAYPSRGQCCPGKCSDGYGECLCLESSLYALPTDPSIVHWSCSLKARAADSRFTRRFQKAAPFCRGRAYIHGWWIPVGVLESWICVRWDVMNSCWNQLSEFWRKVYSFFIYVILGGKFLIFWIGK